MEGSINGGTLEPDIEEIIEKEGYYSWENFSENLIKRTFIGAARILCKALLILPII